MNTPTDHVYEAKFRLDAVMRLARSTDAQKLEHLSGYDLYLLLEPIAERLDKALEEPPRRRREPVVHIS